MRKGTTHGIDDLASPDIDPVTHMDGEPGGTGPYGNMTDLYKRHLAALNRIADLEDALEAVFSWAYKMPGFEVEPRVVDARRVLARIATKGTDVA